MELGSTTCAKHLGGVGSIRLASVASVANVEFDPSQRLFSGLTLREGCELYRVHFADQSACYEERVAADGSVTHTLTFGMLGLQRDVVREIERLSVDGVVAVVERSEGEKLLVGYSPEAATLYPLRLAQALLDSGKSRAQRASTTFTLSCVDGSTACRYRE